MHDRTIRAGCLVAAMAAPLALHAQSTAPAVFIANNGNLEGGVSSLKLNAQNQLELVQYLVIGTRPNLNAPAPGANAYEISITPDGRYLAIGHAESNEPLEQITIVEVLPDATMVIAGRFLVPGTPIDVQWVGERRLAVTRTDPTPDQIVIYDFDPSGPSLTEVSTTPAGTTTFYLAKHPTLPVLYANTSSGGNRVFVFRIEPSGDLTLIQEEFTGPFPLDLAVAGSGAWLYAACGISNDRRSVLGFAVDGEGRLAAISGSPFTSLGNSPSHVSVGLDNRVLFVGHGTDSTLRSFTIDPSTGALTATANVFNVGLQGTLGDVHTMGDLVFVTDNARTIDGICGIYAFTASPDGSFTQNGPIVETGGNQPNRFTVWDAPRLCYPDCDTQTGPGVLDIFDFLCFGNRFSANDPYACDCDTATGPGICDIFDFLCFGNAFNAGCP